MRWAYNFFPLPCYFFPLPLSVFGVKIILAYSRMGGCDGRRRSMAERSYPSLKVRGGGREELHHAGGQGWRPGGATPRRRSGVAAGRSYPTPEVRGGGQEELNYARGQGRRPGGAPPRPRSEAAAGRS